MTAVMRRPIAGFGITNHPVISITGGFGGRRPCTAYSAAMTNAPFSLSGPSYKGMDPSDVTTHVRQWNPQPGMIARLNYDGAAVQDRTPTGLQRGPQARRPRKLRMG
jgi:hypothetical protein